MLGDPQLAAVFKRKRVRSLGQSQQPKFGGSGGVGAAAVSDDMLHCLLVAGCAGICLNEPAAAAESRAPPDGSSVAHRPSSCFSSALGWGIFNFVLHNALIIISVTHLIMYIHCVHNEDGAYD